MQKEKIFDISKFMEDDQNDVFGFTITYKNGKIKNYFFRGNLEDNKHQIEKLKRKYKDFIKKKE